MSEEELILKLLISVQLEFWWFKEKFNSGFEQKRCVIHIVKGNKNILRQLDSSTNNGRIVENPQFLFYQ
jgi:hypothetical protein